MSQNPPPPIVRRNSKPLIQKDQPSRRLKPLREQDVAPQRWNLDELRSLVRGHYGPAQLQKLRPPLRSVIEREYYASFHYHSAMDLVKDVIGDRDDTQVLEDLVLMADEDASDRFSEARYQAAAHVIACLQSLHARADTLSHVLYYGLGMDLDVATQLGERQVDLRRVSSAVAGMTDGTALGALLQELSGHAGFKYVDDLVNFSKHRSIVDTAYSVSFQQQRHGLLLQSFTRNGITHPPRWVNEALPQEFDRQNVVCINIGIELNNIVRSRSAAANGIPV